MSKMKTSAHSDLRPVDNVKRSKRSLPRIKTLQDLPNHLLERILLNAVAMEVRGLHLAKSVWKEKSELVIDRLKAVSSQWTNILTTDEFRNEVHKILDGTAEKRIRLEVLYKNSILLNVLKVITMKDELFMLCKERGENYTYALNVYDRNNMEEVKDVIDLEGLRPEGLAACSLSNCVYLLNREVAPGTWNGGDILPWLELVVVRIARDEQSQFYMLTWIRLDPGSMFADISVSTSGDILILLKCPFSSVVRVFGADRSFLRDVRLEPDVHRFTHIFSVIQKSSGNLLLVAANDKCETKCLEMDATDERIVRRYQSSSLGGYSVGNFADVHGRILLSDWNNRTELLDSELNLLEFTGPSLVQKQSVFTYEMHYDSERNQIVRVDDSDDPNASVLTIFRFVED